VEQIHSWEANSLLSSQKIPRFNVTRRFITVFTRVRQFRGPV